MAQNTRQGQGLVCALWHKIANGELAEMAAIGPVLRALLWRPPLLMGTAATGRAARTWRRALRVLGQCRAVLSLRLDFARMWPHSCTHEHANTHARR